MLFSEEELDESPPSEDQRMTLVEIKEGDLIQALVPTKYFTRENYADEIPFPKNTIREVNGKTISKTAIWFHVGDVLQAGKDTYDTSRFAGTYRKTGKREAEKNETKIKFQK